MWKLLKNKHYRKIKEQNIHFMTSTIIKIIEAILGKYILHTGILIFTSLRIFFG